MILWKYLVKSQLTDEILIKEWNKLFAYQTMKCQWKLHFVKFLFFFSKQPFFISVLLDLVKKYDNTINNKLVSPMTFILIIIIII